MSQHSIELTDLFQDCTLTELQKGTTPQTTVLNFDSRAVEPNTAACFFALSGTQTDGHRYIEKAIDNGATTIVAEHFTNIPLENYPNVGFWKSPNSAETLAMAAKNYHGRADEQLKIIGITGTNGKTSVATLGHSLCLQMGLSAGLISTVENKLNHESLKSTHTTPDPLQLHKLFAKMVQAGVQVCFMEVSSHALHQKRCHGVDFDVALFTNITHDHLDYHQTFRHYLNAKKILFDGLKKEAVAIVNSDDKNGRYMLQNCVAQKQYSFALRKTADYKAHVKEADISGMLLKINQTELYTTLVGNFNAYNLTSVYAVAHAFLAGHFFGNQIDALLPTISQLKAAEGRFDVQHFSNDRFGIVDYAHTPDALENVLSTLRQLCQKNQRIITIIGCGGNRDQSKRPLMGEIATRYSDEVIFTSDNPRNEDPEQIIADMVAGVSPENEHKYSSNSNRKEAIRQAAKMSQSGDMVLLAGKGHEKTQQIGHQILPFDDKIALAEAFEKTSNKKHPLKP